MFPIDTIKTNMQAFRPNLSGSPALSVYKTTTSIVEQHGVVGLFRGVSAMATGAAPAHAMHFATYEFCKKRFGGNKEGHHPFSTAAAGICATIISDAILTPMDAVKQRMQLGARKYNGMIDCVKTIVGKEGVTALYAGYTTTLIMNIPYVAIYFASYESLRKFLKRGSEHEFDPLAHCLAGGGAGMLAATLTNPFDVAKTRLQTQGDVGRQYKGMVNTMLTIWKEEGKSGYTRGLKPRIALHSMSAAICWVTYEWMKFALARMGIGA
jgi:solute carrier family 25 iron transporter 28/37